MNVTGHRPRSRTISTHEGVIQMNPAAGRRRRGQEGQTLVLMVLALVALLSMTALIVDGGNAWAQQRGTQNASDAAAEAGAVVLAQNIGAVMTQATPTGTDQDVLNAVDASASNNGISTPTAWYTDITGNQLDPPVQVGSLGAVTPPSAAYGVEVDGSKTFRTYFAGVAGFNQFSASARATAIAGELTGFCEAPVCGMLPVTFPSSISTCNANNNKYNIGTPGGPYTIVTGDMTASNESIVPLCGTGPGSVGWLAIAPEDSVCGGGVNDLACDIQTPDNPVITFPIWVQTETGNTNNTQVDTAMNSWDGKTVYLPLFDCLENGVGQVSPGPACPNPPQTVSGNNTYYHLIGAIGFHLDHAYIQGDNSVICNSPPGLPLALGNGATGCLKGWFVLPITQGPVGMPQPGVPGPLGVQLIK